MHEKRRWMRKENIEDPGVALAPQGDAGEQDLDQSK